MGKNKKRIFGWFGWSMVGVFLVIGISSTILFSDLFGLNIFGSQNNINDEEEAQAEQISDEMNELVERTRETVGKTYKNVGEFVSEKHAFYNDTTGYGAINSLNWEDQFQQAKNVEEKINDLLQTVENEPLKKDLSKIQQLAQRVQKEKDATIIRDLHRMFHDLDIALNDYSQYDKIWDVTETLKIVN